jgi:hypothetical protein
MTVEQVWQQTAVASRNVILLFIVEALLLAEQHKVICMSCCHHTQFCMAAATAVQLGTTAQQEVQSHPVAPDTRLFVPQVVEKVLLADQPTKQLVKPEDLAAMVLHLLLCPVYCGCCCCC